jgi:hypothetical protein
VLNGTICSYRWHSANILESKLIFENNRQLGRLVAVISSTKRIVTNIHIDCAYTNWSDKLPDDIKTVAMASAKFSKEKGIFPLLESNLSNFETNFIQAGRYFYNYIVQISSIIISRYQNQEHDIISNMTESFFKALNEARNEFDDRPIELLMMDSIDVIENFIKLSSMSTFALDPQYYTMVFDAFINVSVFVSLLFSQN